MVRKSNVYTEFLEREGYKETIPKKNVRILFNCKNGSINDLMVEEFTEENMKYKQYLYKTYNFDFGNCLSDWDEWNFIDVLIKIFVSYNVPFEKRKNILFELSKVEEWRDHLSFWIWKNFSGEG